MNINDYIDSTILSQTATTQEIINLCNEAKEFGFKAVCIQPHFIKLSKEILKGTKVNVCTVIGFPLGQNTTKTKVFETENAISDGADEIDMVINISLYRSNKIEEFKKDIESVKNACQGKCLKVIFETALLKRHEIEDISKICQNIGVTYLKTSTGFSTRGASLEDISIMKEATSGKVKIKASGGIRDYKTAKEYIDLGVQRIGTSSGKKIYTESTC